MHQGRIIIITGSPGTGKTTIASIVAHESDFAKSVHMHTDDFYHYLVYCQFKSTPKWEYTRNELLPYCAYGIFPLWHNINSHLLFWNEGIRFVTIANRLCFSPKEFSCLFHFIQT